MGKDFAHILEVLDWVRRGLVLVHKDTAAKGQSEKGQGEQFVEHAQIGDYFYLCHGNEEPGIILLGQFAGPANVLSDKGWGWADRPFRWIKTAISTKRYKWEKKWWTPNDNSTFVRVAEDDLSLFEKCILVPYFDLKLAKFRIET